MPSAVRRAGRAAGLTASWWMSAPRRPRRLLQPSASIANYRRKSSRARPSVGPSATDQREDRVLTPLTRGDLGDDLLRQHVERQLRDYEAIELAATDAVEQCCAFDQLVARQREEPALRRAATAWPSGQRAAGSSRSSAASRAGRPDQRRRCRCRARARRLRRAP